MRLTVHLHMYKFNLYKVNIIHITPTIYMTINRSTLKSFFLLQDTHFVKNNDIISD